MPVLLNKTENSKLVLINGKPSAFLCSGKEEMDYEMPVEVRVFGGNRSSEKRQEYAFKTIEEFLLYQPDPESCKLVLQRMSEAGDESKILRISGAFTVLATLIQPMTLYRAMKKSPALLHQALARINAWLIDYASAALQSGVAVISFADPCGLSELVGKEPFISFIAKYQYEFLAALETKLTNSVVHICGKNSMDLERYGFIKSEKSDAAQQSYGEEVLQRAQDESFAFCGHGCIVDEEAACRWIWKLTLVKQRS